MDQRDQGSGIMAKRTIEESEDKILGHAKTQLINEKYCGKENLEKSSKPTVFKLSENNIISLLSVTYKLFPLGMKKHNHYMT